MERAMVLLLPAARLATVVMDDDHAIGELGAPAGRETLGELAPRGDELLAAAAALGLALAAAVRMVDGVHGDAADVRAPAQPAGAAGLAEGLLAVVAVADDADGGAALGVHQPELARGHA